MSHYKLKAMFIQDYERFNKKSKRVLLFYEEWIK